jgi:hypothetical protein
VEIKVDITTETKATIEPKGDDAIIIITDGNTNGVTTSAVADGKICSLLTVNGNELNETPAGDGNSAYNQAESKRVCTGNEPSVGARSGPGEDVIGMDALCYDIQKAEGAEPGANGGLGQTTVNSGTKREQTETIAPEDLPTEWERMSHKQRKNFRQRYGRKKELSTTKT